MYAKMNPYNYTKELLNFIHVKYTYVHNILFIFSIKSNLNLFVPFDFIFYVYIDDIPEPGISTSIYTPLLSKIQI